MKEGKHTEEQIMACSSKGLMFISLDLGVLDALRAELEGRGVDVKLFHAMTVFRV